MKKYLSVPILTTTFGLISFSAPPATGQWNFGGGCEFDVWQAYGQFQIPSCYKYPGLPGQETVMWSYVCSQGSDCTGASNSAFHEPFESRGELSLTLSGQCGSSVADTHCPYAWDYVMQGDLWFEASGRNGQLQTVPIPPLGLQFEIQCSLHSSTIVGTSCSYCGHPCEEPVIISLDDQEYQLTDTRGGVWFDLSADGRLQRIPWTSKNSDDVFLVLDRNGNGIVDDGAALFSHVSPQPVTDEDEAPHGFRALAVFDDPDNGGNADGQISLEDAIYRHLRLWRDADHDGQTDGGELQPLRVAELQAISLNYTSDNEHQDRHGNIFKFSAPAQFTAGRSVNAWVVYFNLETCPSCTLPSPTSRTP